MFRDEAGEKVVHALVPGNEYIVGRGAQAELRIRNPSISREHAKIWFASGAWCVQDLGSSNFTFVNNAKITQATFADGDTVRFGDFAVKIADDGADAGGGDARSRRPRPGAVEEEPAAARRPRPSAVEEEAPARRPRPSAVEEEVPARRPRPSAVEEEVPARRPRPGAVEEEVPARRPRPGAVEDEVPARRPRPGAVEDEVPARRPRPGAVEDEVPARRPRPGAVEDEVPARRPRPGAVEDEVPARRPRPGAVEDEVPARRPRPGAVEEEPVSRRSRPSEAPVRAPEPEPVREVPPRQAAPQARAQGMVGVDPAQLRAAQEKANKLDEELRDARARFQEQLGRIQDLEQRESRFDGEISGWNDRYNKVREQLDHNQELLERAKEEIREHEATIEAFEREVADLEASLQQAEAQRDQEAGTLSDLKSKVVQKDRRIDELQRELDLMEFDLRNAREELEAVQDSMNHENTEQRKLEREAALLREVINEKENVVKELQIEIEEQERQIYDLRMGTGVKNLEQARADMLEKYFEKNREAEELRKKLSTIEKKFGQMEVELREYEQKLTDSRDVSQHPDFQRKQRELDRAVGDADEVRDELERLKQKLDQFGPEQKAKLDAELNFLRRKNQALEEKLENLEQDNETRAASSAELTFARKKNEALEDKIETLEEAVTQARRELEEARRAAQAAEREAQAANERAAAAPPAAAAPAPESSDSTSQSSVATAMRVDALQAIDELVELYGSWRSNISLMKSYVDEAKEVASGTAELKGPVDSITEVMTVILADAGDMRRELKNLQTLLSGD